MSWEVFTEFSDYRSSALPPSDDEQCGDLRGPRVVDSAETLFVVDSTMIRLTRLNGTPLILNAELIRYVEQLPDTYVTLTSGDRLIVQESMDVVMDRAIEYHRQKSLLPQAVVSSVPVLRSSPSETFPSQTGGGQIGGGQIGGGQISAAEILSGKV